MKHLTVKTLLALFAGITLCGFGATAVLLTLQNNRANSALHRIVGVEEALLGHLQELYAQGLQTGQATRNVVLNPADGKAQGNYAAADKKFRRTLQDAERLAPPEMAERLQAILPIWEKDGALKRQAMILAAGGRANAAAELLNTRETAQWRAVKKIIQGLIAAQSRKSKQSFVEFQNNETRNFRLILGIGMLALACTAILLWRGSNMILAPLHNIRDFAKHQAEGRYSKRLAGVYAGELGEVAAALETMTAKLQSALGYTRGVLQGIATPFMVVDEGENVTMTNQPLLRILGHEGSPEDFYGRKAGFFFYGEDRRTVLADAMEQKKSILREMDITDHKGSSRRIHIAASPLYNAISGDLLGALCLYTDLTELRAKESQILAQNAAVTQAARDAGSVVSALLDCSQRLSEQVGKAEDGAAHQRERAGATVDAMGDMSGAIKGSAESADEAAKGAESTAQKAEEGADAVRQVMASVEDVRGLSLELKENMGGLGRQAEAIGRIMSVISDIADQTNLLALNAAIEAARAGDAGRGFAVVADEVRKLAEKTMSATKEVGEAIRGIQEGTRNNVAQAERSAQTIESTSGLAARSGEALHEIVGMMADTTQRVRGIATAVELQSNAADQINAAVEEINDIAQQTSAGMDAAARDVEELRRLADQLREVVQSMAAG